MDKNKMDALRGTPINNVGTIASSTRETSSPRLQEQKFNSYNPLSADNFKFKRMYWNSILEIIARSVILGIGIIHFIIVIFLVTKVINPFLVSKGIMRTTGPGFTTKHIVYIGLAVTFAYNFSIFLPMGIGRTVSSVYGWSIAYIVMSMFYFVFIEAACAALLIVVGTGSADVTRDIPIFMILGVVITIVWIVAACVLMVKSDDLRRKLSIE